MKSCKTGWAILVTRRLALEYPQRLFDRSQRATEQKFLLTARSSAALSTTRTEAEAGSGELRNMGWRRTLTQKAPLIYCVVWRAGFQHVAAAGGLGMWSIRRGDHGSYVRNMLHETHRRTCM